MSWLFYFTFTTQNRFFGVPVTSPEYFSNDAYFNSLRTDTAFGVSTLYSLFREDTAKTLVASGWGEAEAAHCFRLAVCDIAQWAREGYQPEEPLGQLLKARSLAHAALLRPIQEQEAGAEPSAEETDLLQSQQKAAVWSALTRLQPPCQEALLAEPTSAEGACFEALQSEMGAQALPSDRLTAALADVEGFRTWQYTAEHEHTWQKTTAPAPAAEPLKNKTWRWITLTFLIVTVAYAVYQFFFRPKTVAELYASNFNPPRSLMADWEQRRTADTSDTAPAGIATEACLMLLHEADAFYQQGDYRSATDPLLLIVLDTAAACQADAWFYLGIIHLHLKDPVTAIQCLAKIEDLERFGEDIYWYQVMAYLQIAQNTPHQRERIAKAVELAIPNIQNPKRRAQAEALLESLSP